MITLLKNIVEIFLNIPLYIIYAIESIINLFFAGIELVLNAAAALLGELPGVTTPPEYIGEINWFYPVGTMVPLASTLLTLYIAWLGFRSLYKKFGAM